MEEKLYLVLENGTVFEGKPFGAAGEAVGEVVFTTSMTGYMETITDPSYFGQIVVQTFPLAGNYGVIDEECESGNPALKAYIVREWCQEPSNFRSKGNLDTFLKQKNIIGLWDIDTRALTKILREYGVMNGMISKTKEVDFDALRQYKIENAVKSVSDGVRATVGEGDKTIVLVDFRARHNAEHALTACGCKVEIVPGHTKAEEILALSPSGILLSDGPGDPMENAGIIAEIKVLCEKKIPMFGIGLGHQLLALSQGAKTQKLKYGHRGASQPVAHKSGRIYITSQNHGYTILADTLPKGAQVSFQNVNDNTVEGVEYEYMPAFSVQFQPVAAAGPQDTSYLFDQFISCVEEVHKICR